MPVLPRRHLHTLKIERVLLATLQIVHVKSADDLLPLDHIAGVDRSLPCARFQANRRCFRVLGIRSAGTARKASRRANQADGRHHEVATIEVLSTAHSFSLLERWAITDRANSEQSGRASKI